MTPHIRLFALLMAAVGLVGCNEQPITATQSDSTVSSKYRPEAEYIPAGDFANEWACGIRGAPDSATINVSDTLALSSYETYCKVIDGVYSDVHDYNHFDIISPVYWSNGNSSVVSMTNGVGLHLGATVVGLTPGTSNITLYDCTNPNVTCPNLTFVLPVKVVKQPLTAAIYGEMNVNTNINCDYSVTPHGGIPPYGTYLWSVDGTLVDGQGTSGITANFASDGTHLVSVKVTDVDADTTYGNLYVTSSTASPPELTCAQ